MTTSTNALRRAAVAILATASLVLSGCGIIDEISTSVTGPENAAEECPKTPLPPAEPGLVLAVSVHEGAPAPSVPATLEPVLAATLAAGNPVAVIAVDGTPEVVAMKPLDVSDATCDAFASTLDKATKRVADTVVSAKADSDGNDLYGAIELAAATTTTMPDGTLVVVIDSGLSDRGPLDYSRAGMTLTEPEVAATYAAKNRPVSEVSGVRFQLMLGYTAAPQQPLSGTERDNVVATWEATLVSLGAGEVLIASQPRPSIGPETRFTTLRAPVAELSSFEPPTTAEPTTVVFREDQVRFLPDSTQLADPRAASKALVNVVAWLRADPSNTVTVTGTTSSAGTEAGRLRVSRQRAATVAALLVAGGEGDVARRQIETRGVGTHFPEYVDDRLPDGGLDPLVAPANRTVRITAHPAA
jgi:OOP family OmpA-OmpF porin